MNSIFPLGDDLACRRNFALYLFLGSVGGSAIFSLPLPPMFWFFFSCSLSLSLSLFFSLFFLFFFIFFKLTWQRCFLIRLISRDSGHRVASARSLLEKLHPGGPSPAASVQLCHRTFKSCWRRRALHRRVPVIGRSSTKSSAGLVSLPTREASLQGSVSRAPVSRLTSINSWPNLNFFLNAAIKTMVTRVVTVCCDCRFVVTFDMWQTTGRGGVIILSGCIYDWRLTFPGANRLPNGLWSSDAHVGARALRLATVSQYRAQTGRRKSSCGSFAFPPGKYFHPAPTLVAF